MSVLMPYNDSSPPGTVVDETNEGANQTCGHPSSRCWLNIDNSFSWGPFMTARGARQAEMSGSRKAIYGILPIVHPVNKLLAIDAHRYAKEKSDEGNALFSASSIKLQKQASDGSNGAF